MRKYLLLAIYIIMVMILMFSCKGSTSYREKHGLINIKTIEYKIQSIRIDDDAEYHIIAVSKNGNVKTIADAKSEETPYLKSQIKIRFSDTPYPKLLFTISDRCCGEGNFTQEGSPEIVLPLDYKIETFDD